MTAGPAHPRAPPSPPIAIRGASEHNLKGISLDLPAGALTVFTGVSGSGKSSLAHDTIYREGQRRFLESLPAYARQYLGSVERPRVERIDGLSPTLAIDQKTAGRSPRSTVGTMTELYDHLRLLYARLGTPHCPRCGRTIEPQSPARIADRILDEHLGRTVLLCAPVVRGRKGEYRKKLLDLRAAGHVRLRVDGRLVRLDREEPPPLSRYRRHTLEIVHDRIDVRQEARSRLTESLEKCLELAGGVVSVLVLPEGSREGRRGAAAPPPQTERLFSSRFACPACGEGIPEMEPRLFSFNSPHGACPRCQGLGEEDGLGEDLGPPGARAPCSACGGSRLRPEARSVRFRGRAIAELCALPAGDLLAFIEGLRLEGAEAAVGEPILREIASRLRFLSEVGLDYLTLTRGAASLAGGEAQRLRLASLVGGRLEGVLFVLDEPSIGLHPRDTGRLLATLRRLRDRGNTVLVVEHDRETIEAADHLVDIGPGAGKAGGEVVAEGRAADLARSERSLTGKYLSGERRIPVPERRRVPGEHWLELLGASLHNLKGIDVRLPLGLLVVLTGVSGSGKSSLASGVLKPAVLARLRRRSRAVPPGLRELRGAERIAQLVEIDQSPIGKSPRSNPATYTRLFGLIRELYASLPEARARGWGPERFSFNRQSGRCLACRGAGVVEIEMQFLSPVEIVCEECDGRRYSRETLEVLYRGRSISEVLALPVREALDFFRDHPRIRRILEVMDQVGLGYVELGQPSTLLSGGEAQRVKLAAELHRPESGRTLYLLDEPTTGLHFEDVRTLLAVLNRLVDRGNTVLVIEHNPEVMKSADWIVDLGPEGGEAGGRVVAAGPPESVARERGSYTGQALALELEGARRAPPGAASPPGGSAATAERWLEVRGASKHNLKRIDVRIPKNRMTVVTGVSGSGKTSLAFDTIFTEGQRRYIESLSTYARRFLGRLESAPVESIRGLAPAIAIDQKSAPRSPRSTLATITEIHDHLRLLYARIGRPHCPACERALEWTDPSRLAARLAAARPRERGYLLAPIAAAEAGLAGSERQRKAARAALVREGFTRLLIGGNEVRLDPAPGEAAPPAGGAPPAAPGGREEGPYLVIDRVVIGEEARTRIAGSLELAFARGRGRAAVQVLGSPLEIHSREPACPGCGFRFPGELSPRMFSFNSHAGACPRCSGLGVELRVVPPLLIADPRRPLLDGALEPQVHSWLLGPGAVHLPALGAMARALRIRLDLPVGDLDSGATGAVLDGTGEARYALEGREASWPGLAALLAQWHRRVRSAMKPRFLEAVLRERVCSLCAGGRLRPESLRVRIGGSPQGPPGLGIAEVSRLTVAGAARFFEGLELGGNEARIAEAVLAEVRNRLRFLLDVGLEYLTLDRPANSLSGGEAQRIRLASQLGNRLVGVLYVLDEPTVGLHPRDTARLLTSLRELRDLGNTVILVEHDRDTIESADWVVDLGPEAGARGGEVLASGPPADIRRSERSLTGRYLGGEARVAAPRERRQPSRGADGRVAAVRLLGVSHHNLRQVDVEFPLGLFTAVSGVSGSGKSSLVVDVLAHALRQALERGAAVPGAAAGDPAPAPSPRLRAIEGAEAVRRVVLIDQSPIGRSPRSNAATYTGLWDEVRALFAQLPQARVRGYGPERFSFNLPGGRCETCRGEGALRVEMHFLSDVWLPCDDCKGSRFNRPTLEVRYRGLHAGEVLELEAERARELFADHPRARAVTQVLCEVGMGYLKLGQPATTLSGGEAQRVKLAAELHARLGGGVFYILDEPTTGLHFEDVRRLLDVLHRLVDGGNTLAVIEHNLDVLKSADWIVDLGPEAGEGGGRVVAAGPPEAIARCAESHTGRFLKN